jgi:hypothetical protein
MKTQLITYKEVMERLEKKSIAGKVNHLRSEFLMHVDTKTIAYRKTVLGVPQEPQNTYTPVNLTNQERMEAIEALRWFKRDIQECINHLEE